MTKEQNIERPHKGAAAISVFLCSDSSCWCWAEDRAKREQASRPSKTESFPLGILHKGVRFHIANERDALRLLFTMVRDNVCSVEQAMSCMKEMPSVETTTELCPNCGKDEVGTFTADDSFLYGSSNPVRLVAKDVLFFRCMACHLEYTGEDGEEKRMEAIRAHLTTRSAVEPAAEQPKDYAEVVLRVEIASDTDQKVESFRQQLCDAILAAPAALRADVMVTIHREGQLSVFETNRTPVKATADLPACECLVRNKAPSAYHNIKCPRYVADLL